MFNENNINPSLTPIVTSYKRCMPLTLYFNERIVVIVILSPLDGAVTPASTIIVIRTRRIDFDIMETSSLLKIAGLDLAHGNPTHF